MRKTYLYVALGAICGGMIGSFATFSIIKSGNYETCLVDGMRGNTRQVFSLVQDMCSKTYKREIVIPARENDLRFNLDDTSIAVTLPSFSREFEFTRADFKMVFLSTCSGGASLFDLISEQTPAIWTSIPYIQNSFILDLD